MLTIYMVLAPQSDGSNRTMRFSNHRLATIVQALTPDSRIVIKRTALDVDYTNDQQAIDAGFTHNGDSLELIAA